MFLLLCGGVGEFGFVSVVGSVDVELYYTIFIYLFIEFRIRSI